MYPEFIIVDPASSVKPKANYSVAYWCVVLDRVCVIHGGWFGQVYPLDLAKALYYAAYPTGEYPSFKDQWIPTIHVEGESTCATVRQRIEELAPIKGWNIQPIPISNEKGAKVERIRRAHKAMDDNWIRMDLLHTPASAATNSEIERRLRAQLKAKDKDYQDGSGRDDFADLLGLTCELVFGENPPTTPAPAKPGQSNAVGHKPWCSISQGGLMCTCKESEPDDNPNYGQSGGSY